MKENLDEKMLKESQIIIDSCEFLIKQMQVLIKNFDYFELKKEKKKLNETVKNIRIVIKKLDLEQENMDNFLIKYKNLISKEKKKQLLDCFE